ncbi:MAG: type II toxin-antitoxin system RelB/DinJ family antitoxin [Clostridiales Family XIII bacterium]|nr:type II toxin-antitoxin system RelB/DinJ family antitoxin [Clostridiales Family XIII bacterium]
MAQTNLSVRIDEQDKKRFETFCNNTGMNVSVAVNMFVKTVLREQRLPFAVQLDPFYSPENMESLRASAAALEAGRGIVRKTMADLEAMENEQSYRL